MKSKVITDADFKEADTCAGTKFIEFFAPWCPHCQRMMPIIEGLEKEYKGKVEFFLVDVDQSPAACDKYGVSSMPTMFFFKKNSSRQEDMLVGEQAVEDLKEILDKII